MSPHPDLTCSFCRAALPEDRAYRIPRAGRNPLLACFGCVCEWDMLCALNARFPELLADPRNRADLVRWGLDMAETWPDGAGKTEAARP